MGEVEKVRIEVSEAALADLQRRLQRRVRIQKPAPSLSEQDETPWKTGTDIDYLERLLEYWEKEYDWREAEAKLNAFGNFRTKIDNVDLHFIHERNENPDAIPLLIVHGWPGSVFEFNRLIPLLMEDKNHPFHIVAPSLPGFAWSTVDDGAMLNYKEIGAVFDKLMTRLGYSHYCVQGGDWGAYVVDRMAKEFGDHVAALHLNMNTEVEPVKPSIRVLYKYYLHARDILWPHYFLTPEEERHVVRLKEYLAKENSYLALQATKPQMLSVAFNDSPVALASWLVEKFQGWTHMQQGSDPNLPMFDIVTDICIYWFTESIGTSMRMYTESLALLPGQQFAAREVPYCSVPTGVSAFPREIVMFPRRWTELTHNLKSWVPHAHGGHFAAWERPVALKTDIQQFFYHVVRFDECVELCKKRNRGSEPQDNFVPEVTVKVAALAGAGLILYKALSSRL